MSLFWIYLNTAQNERTLTLFLDHLARKFLKPSIFLERNFLKLYCYAIVTKIAITSISEYLTLSNFETYIFFYKFPTRKEFSCGGRRL